MEASATRVQKALQAAERELQHALQASSEGIKGGELGGNRGKVS